MKLHTLKATRKKAAVPLAGRNRLALTSAHGSQNDKSGEVLRLTAEPVVDPGTHAGTAGDLRSGIHESVRRIVVDLHRTHRLHDRNIIRQFRNVRKNIGNHLTGFTMTTEAMLRPHAGERLPLQLCNRLAVGERCRHRLAVHLREFRLVVERFEMRGTARHAEKNNPFRPGHVMGLDRPGPALLQAGFGEELMGESRSPQPYGGVI